MRAGGIESVKVLTPSRAWLVGAIEDALSRVAGAAERGYSALISEAEHVFTRATGAASSCVVVHSGGAWRRWDHVGEMHTSHGVVTLPPEVAERGHPTVLEGGLFVPIRTGVLAAILTAPREGKETESVAVSIAVAVELALTALERKHVRSDEGDELEVMQRVALRILKSHDLPEILLLITHETRRLLGADICGIMLREGDAVVMQRCVGNLSPATASLRMEAGQGVAGRVVATKEPCYVENYIGSELISNDFMNLARVEMVRSALAAPLISQDDVVGVLEVWRRQTGKFDEHHVRRLVALANLTSLAIENARLSQARQAMVEQLAATNRALTERFEGIRSSAAFQDELIRLQLEGKNLAQVAARAAEHLCAEVLILDANLAIEGSQPERTELPERLHTAIKAAVRKVKAAPAQAVSLPFDSGTLLVRSASAGAEMLGFVVLLCPAADAGVELALSQICIATSLHLTQRRAAGRARAETLSAVLWDLLEGSEEVRRFALARARDLHVELDHRQRVFVCKLDGIEHHASSEGWSANDVSVCRRRIAQAHRDVVGLASSVKLACLHGNVMALLCGGSAVNDANRLGAELARAIAAHVPGLSVHVGISAPCENPTALHAAYREALISVEVARQRGRVAAATYEDAGIVGLLLSLRDEGDVRKLVRTIFGPLLDQKPDDRERLLSTLGAFFEVNCNRAAAAQRLRVHEKTVAYRLAKVRDLTGLDFSKHENRLLADIALRMHSMTTAGVSSLSG
jgi:sugar diacid utilization regulator/GAF domain-containing protein